MRRGTLIAFFAAAFLSRLAIATATGMFHRSTLTEMEGIARNVAGLGHYGLYYSPTAYSTPPFPLFLALLFKLLGMGLALHLVTVTLACAASALRCALLPLFTLDAGLDTRTALAAGWLGVGYVGALDTEVNGGLDGPYVALALLAVIWYGLRLWRDGTWQLRSPWWFFLLCGFSAFLNPSVLPVIGGLLVVGAIAAPVKARGRYLGQAALTVCGILVFLGPWAIRNEITLGAPILTRSNFGTEFWVSNGPGRTFDHPTNYAAFHPSQNPDEARKVGALGEVEYNREKLAEGMDWVRSHPSEYLRFTAERIAAWWFPPHPVALLAPKLALTLAAVAGLWLLFRRRLPAGWLVLITWLTFPDLYYLVQWSSRYRYPMDWQLVFCASVALAAGWGAMRSRQAARGLPAAL